VDADGDVDGNDRTAVNAALNATIDQAAYRSEFDIDRSGTITTADRTIASTTRSALAGGLISNAATGGPDNPIGWDGYVFNAETRLYTVRYRTYEPVLGRWMERDPIEFMDSSNLVEQVQSAPSNWLDPAGLQSVPAPVPAPPGQVPPLPSPPLRFPGEGGPYRFPIQPTSPPTAPAVSPPPAHPRGVPIPNVRPAASPILILPALLDQYIKNLEERNRRDWDRLNEPIPDPHALPDRKVPESHKRRLRDQCKFQHEQCMDTRLADCDENGSEILDDGSRYFTYEGGRCHRCYRLCVKNANKGDGTPWPDETEDGRPCQYWLPKYRKTG
jgi:RHS repeat-associated protein